GFCGWFLEFYWNNDHETEHKNCFLSIFRQGLRLVLRAVGSRMCKVKVQAAKCDLIHR
ncbi:unnamed protein product, partial [Musa textilis]